MASTGATVTVNTRGLQRKLDKWQKGLSTKQLLEAIGNVHIRWVDKNFKAEGIEKRWKPLSPKTIARRRKGSSRILQDTGKLKGSFNKGRSGNVHKIRGTEVSVGTNVVYASTHEHGRGKIPKRKMLPTERMARKLARDTINNIVKELARGAR